MSATDGFDLIAAVDLSEFERYLTTYEREVIPAVIVAALTSTMRAVRKRVRKRLESQVGMTARESGKRLRIARATPQRYSAWLFLNRKAIVLRKTSAPVNPYVQAKESRSGVRYAKHRFPKAFPLTVDGVRGYFWRPGGAPLRIAHFPMDPPGAAILEEGVVQYGGELWERTARDFLARALARRGSFRASEFIGALGGGADAA